MKIKLSEVNEEGLRELRHRYHPEKENLNFDDQHFSDGIEFVANAKKESDILFIEGTLESNVERQCSRCLAFVKQPFKEEVRLSLDAKDRQVIDITDDIREILIFQHPIRFICSENCKGICSICGSNKNINSCNCKEEKTSNAFSQLKDKF